jgi:hypothetical protein
MRPLKSLTLEAIVDLLATTFGDVEDSRAADQLSYPLHDTLRSGFALMFFQHPSLLPFQRAREKKRQRCNLQTIFGVHEIPSDPQMREIVAGVKPETIRVGLPQLWEKVRRAGWGGRFTPTLPRGQHKGTYDTVALEGSEYLRSPKIQCPPCLPQTDPQGRVHSSHQIVGATVVRAGSHQVLPLDGEEVRNATAESAPQDGELTAGKRLSTRLGQEPPQRALSMSGDELYSPVPFVEQLLPLRQPFVVVAKPSSQPPLRRAGAGAEGPPQSQTGQWTEGSGARQRIYTSRLVRQVPLALESPVRVTSVEVWEPSVAGHLL